MPHLFKIHAEKVGQSPGTVQFIGQPKVAEVKIRATAYGPQRLVERDVEDILAGGGPGQDEMLWVDVIGLHDTDLIHRLGRRFGIHELVLEDVVSTNQRAKVDQYDDYLFLVCRSSNVVVEPPGVKTEQISIVIGHGFVLSFQESEPDTFTSVRQRLSKPGTRLRSRGAEYLSYALLDTVVDNHLLALSLFGDRIDATESAMVEELASDQLDRIHNLGRDLLVLRKAIRPMRDLSTQLERLEHDLVTPENSKFIADIHDHTIQAGEAIDSYRSTIDSMIDYYQSAVNMRLNDVMKVLTIISTIFVPMTFVAGVYGMNFAHMPELAWAWAYPAALLTMAGIAGGMLVFFRRRKWL